MKRGRLLFLILIIIGLCLVAYAAMSGTSSPSYVAPRSSNTTHTVRYEVTGGESWYTAGLTYENAQGGTEQRDVGLPWSQTYTMKTGDFAYISAQLDNGVGQITCTIYVDGTEWKTSTSSGQYVIASCSGSVGR